MPQIDMVVGMTGVANGDDSSGANARLQLKLCFLAVHGGPSAPMIMQAHPDRPSWGRSGSPASFADTGHGRQSVERSQERAHRRLEKLTLR